MADELIDPSSEMQLTDLGTGLAFGSKQREHTNDILFSQIDLIPLQMRRDILAFDRWIRNYDRSLSAQAGNPNLLWDSETNSVVVIDHNNAFDAPMGGQVFAEQHIFGSEFLPLCQNKAELLSYHQRLDGVLEHWPEIVASVPPEWMFLDSLETVPVNFDFESSLSVLGQHRSEGFWSW